jgi:type III secretion protein J
MRIGLVGCVGVTLLFMACEQYDPVMTDLSQREANVALVLLRDKSFDAKKEALPSKKATLYQISVKKSQAKEALRLLVENRLPMAERAGLKDIYPPGNSGFIPSKSEEAARFLMASQGEIESLLKVIPGVRDARVVLSYEPQSDPFKTAPKKTAAVALLYFGSEQPPLDDREVKSLVASSMSGLDKDDVTVVQKAMTVSDENFVTQISSAMAVPASEERGMEWYLFAITALALVVATYGVFRLFVQRRASSTLT